MNIDEIVQPLRPVADNVVSLRRDQAMELCDYIMDDAIDVGTGPYMKDDELLVMWSGANLIFVPNYCAYDEIDEAPEYRISRYDAYLLRQTLMERKYVSVELVCQSWGIDVLTYWEL